jgi:hypothetical protein
VTDGVALLLRCRMRRHENGAVQQSQSSGTSEDRQGKDEG